MVGRLLAVVVVVGCGDNIRAASDATIAVSDAAIDTPEVDAPAVGPKSCALDSECDSGHCVPNVPTGTGGTCCSTACVAEDACHVAQCSTGVCQSVDIATGRCVVNAAGDQLSACGVAALGCGAVADTDGDNLPDAWETTDNGAGAPFLDVNCNGRWDPATEPVLAGASPTVPDIYVRYDFMGLGRDDDTCATTADCTALGAYHAGETCNLMLGQCQFTCSQDTDCTGRSGASHAGEACRLFDGGGPCSDSAGSPTGACACFHTHDPDLIAPGALQKVVDVFALHGVALHLQRGVERPHSHVVSYRSDAELDISCEGASVAAGTAGPGKYATSFYDLKSLPASSQYITHYALFAHLSGCDSPAHCPASVGNTSSCASTTYSFGQAGMAEFEGNDIVVSLGDAVNRNGFAPGVTSTAGFSQIGATLMHELGHNLGLRHDGHVDMPCPQGSECSVDDVCMDLGEGEGKVCHETVGSVIGAEEPNYKPNYVSLMNYLYEGGGIQSSSTQNVAAPGTAYTPGSNVPDPALTRLDFSNQVLATLVENNLDDTTGVGWTGDALYPGAYLLFAYIDGTCHLCPQIAPASGSVDWTCTGCATNATCQLIGTGPSVFGASGLSADVDDATGSCSAPSDVLHGHKDWGSFVYAFQCTPNSISN